jgi:hypothetical protein
MNVTSHDSSKLKFISAPCGSGKTSELCKHITERLKDNNSSHKFIIAQNTQILATKTAENIEGSKLIISDLTNGRKSVLTLVIDFLNNPTSKVLIISDKTFFKISVDLLKGWEVWLDDVTNFHSYKSVNDSNPRIKQIIYNDFMQEHVVLDETKEKYLTATKKTIKGDLIYKISEELSVINENDIFIMNNDYFIEEDKVQLSILGWKDLTKYQGLPITFMGANFENSLIYKTKPTIFEKTSFANLQQRTIPLEKRIKVYYFSERIRLSKTWKTYNASKLQGVYDYLNKNLMDVNFYWTNNNNDKHKLSKGLKISPDARGLNDYSNYNTCVWLACMQPDDNEAKLCELLLNIGREDIHLAREYESLHQFVLRGVSRQFTSTEIQIVYVFDKFQAESLSDNIEHIPGVIDSSEVNAPGRPQGAKNVEKLPLLDDKKSKRFNRWKNANPLLEYQSFHDFLRSKTNDDLTDLDRKAMMARYEKLVLKRGNK